MSRLCWLAADGYVAIVSTYHANITWLTARRKTAKAVEFSSVHRFLSGFPCPFIICETHNSHAFMLDNCKFTLRFGFAANANHSPHIVAGHHDGNSTAAEKLKGFLRALLRHRLRNSRCERVTECCAHEL